MKMNKIKLILSGLIFAASVTLFGTSVNAADIDQGTTTTTIGATVTYTTSSLKINKKDYKKSKKKVKTVVRSVDSQDNYYWTKPYFDSYDAYENDDAYQAENGDQAKKYYPRESEYQLTFMKAGSYKISYVDYYTDSYETSYKYMGDDKYGYYITKYNMQTASYDIISTYVSIPGMNGYYYDDYDEYNRRYYYDDYDESNKDNKYKASDGKTYDKAVEPYLICPDGKIFAYGDEGLVPASLAKGADGKLHVKYTPKKPTKYTFTKTYKILGTDSVVKSVKLGNSKYSYSNKSKVGGYSSVIVRGKFLTGSKGKLVVTMGDKNYKNGGMLVGTYNADGGKVYTYAKNKSNVTFGDNLYKSSYVSDSGKYGNINESMYKETDVIVAYENKASGYGTKIQNMGANKLKITNYERRKYNGKYYNNVKTVYDVTYEKRGSDKVPRYYYTITKDLYDSEKKTLTPNVKQKHYAWDNETYTYKETDQYVTDDILGYTYYEDDEDYWYSSGLITYYKLYTFYKK